MKNKLTKEKADKIMKVKGNIRGSVLKGYYQFILDKEGKNGVKKVEEKLKAVGYPLKLKEIDSFKWYPHSLSILLHLAILDVFEWDESKSFEMGYYGPVYSTITKFLMKYFNSLEASLKQSPKYWRKHFDFAQMSCSQHKKNKKYVIFELKGFKKFHPVAYTYTRGFLTKIMQLATKSKNVKVEQTKSLYNGDSYDEFKVTWQ